MSGKAITLEVDDAGIARITMASEDGKNALSESMVEELTCALSGISGDLRVKVCLLQGLPQVFCSGGSKVMLQALAQGEVASTDIMISRTVLEVPIPTIAVMTGHAIGGGLTLGLCCDIVLMNKASRYGCSFMNMGFTPGMGTTRLLQLAFGEYLAAEMMYGGQFFLGSHFQERSSVNHILPPEKVESQALRIAERIAEKPRLPLELLKRSLSIKKRQLFEEARSVETYMHELCFANKGTLELVNEFYQGTD